MRALALFVLAATAASAQVTAGTRSGEDHSREDAAAARMTAAEAALEKGDLRTAEPLLEQLAKDRPKDAHVWYDLGYVQRGRQQFPAAESSFKAAIALDATYPEPHEGLGSVYVEENKEDAAREEFAKAADMPTASPQLRGRLLRMLAKVDYMQGKFSVASDEMLKAIELTGEQPGDAAVAGELALAAGNLAAAEQQMTRAVAANPNNPEDRDLLGTVLMREDKVAQAEEVLQTGLKVHPDNVPLTVTLAQTEAHAGRNPEAIKLLEGLRERAPETRSNVLISDVLARLYLLENRPADAEPLLREVKGINNNDPRVLDELGESLLKQAKYAESERVLAQAFSMRTAFHDDAAWAETATHLALAAQRNREPDVALQALAARATVLPDSAASLFLQATAHDALHHNKDAERLYRAFLAKAGGKFPDEEFEARHRLIALDHAK